MSQSINLYNQLKHKLFNKTINFDLKRIKLILQKLNHPEKKLKNVINIIGSDGKYSLLTSLKYFIEANNQKTSAYISPSLKNIRERFWMGKEFLSYKEIQKSIKIIESLKIFTLAESLGGVESLAGHPASMTHASIPKLEREKTGVVDSLIRLSVGIEDSEDLIQDLNQAIS